MRGVPVCAMYAMVSIAVTVAPVPTYGETILYVGADGSPSEADQFMLDHLESLSFVGSGNVEYVGALDSSASSADGKDLVIITAAITSGDVGGKFTDVASGVLTWESYIMDDMAMCTNPTPGNWIRTAIFDGGPITTLAGITPGPAAIDLFLVNPDMTGHTFGLPSGAVLEARVPKIPDDIYEYFALFSIEQGEFAGHSAAGRRVGMTGPNASLTPVQFTADGLAMFNAAVEWAASVESGPTLGDFDGDGDLDDVDIDALLDEVVAGTNDEAFDLTGEGTVDSADADEWVRVLRRTEYGDATLDGNVDGADLSLMAAAWLGSGQGWAAGDFTGEGSIDGADLSLMAANWLFSATPAAVPEPATMGLLALGGLALIRRRRS